tara:strand:+ start:209 stop:505 length:297 start_codon:yes stop_codon:yes gene_type:complete
MGNLTWNEVAQTETDKRYMSMYGCTQADLDDMIADEVHPMMGGHYMLAMSILSDAQECIAIGLEDRARRYINRAKYVMRSWNKYDNKTSDVGQTNQTI